LILRNPLIASIIGVYIVLFIGCTVEPVVTGKNDINQDIVGVAGDLSASDGVTSPVTAEQAIESTVAAMLAIESTVSAELAIRSTVSAAVDAKRTAVDNPSVADYLQDTPSLHRAAESNSIDVATLLIDSGVDINAKGTFNMTALHIAADSNSIDVASLLIDRGADIEAKDDEGWTALHIAADRNSLDFATLLINSGADIEVKDHNRGTALHYAAESNSIDVATLLIDRGADIEAKDDEGGTALHYAADRNSIDVATLLIDRGVDIEAKNGAGETAFYAAATSNSLDVASLLIDSGANNDDSIAPGLAPDFFIGGYGEVESPVLPTPSELVKIIFSDGFVPVVNSNEYFRIENFRVSNVEELNSLGGVSASVKWGDGSDWIGVPIMVDTGEIVAGHTYTSAGIFDAEMRIRSDTGDVVNTSFSVLVDDPPTIPPDSLPDNALAPDPAVPPTMLGTATTFNTNCVSDGTCDGIVLFANNCTGCHSTGDKTVVGPGLAGVADRAASRVAGLSAGEYLEQSLREPRAFVVDGFPMIMPEWSHLGNDSIDALVEYLKTLK